MRRHGEREMEQNVVMGPVPLPIDPIEVVIVIVWIRPMKVGKVLAKDAGHEGHTPESRQGRHALSRVRSF